MIFIKTIMSSRKLIVLLDQGIFSGMSFLLNILMAHLLIASDFGLFSSIILINYLLISITNSLVINPMQVNLARVRKKDGYVLFNLYFQFFLTVLLLVSSQVIFLFSFAKGYLYLRNPLLLFCFFFLFHDFFRKIFLAKDDIKACLLVDSLQFLGQLTSVFVFYFKGYTSLSAFIYGLSIGYLPGLIVGVLKIKFRQYSFVSFKFYFLIHIKQGSWLLFTAFLQWTSGNFFTMVSGIYLGLEALGAFRLVQSLFGLLNILLQTFENYALPIASQLRILSIHKANAYIKRLTIQAGYLFLAVLFILFMFSEQVMLIFGGEKYIAYSYIVKWMTLLYVMIYLSYPLRMAIRLAKQNQFIFIGYLLSFLFSVGSFHFFLKYWSLAGAVVGLMINQLLLMAYWKYVLTSKKL